MQNIIGFVNINKPKGITSHSVVAKLRRYLKISKIGHSGTLDPIASGVLVCGVGKAARLLSYIGDEKEYRIKVRLGMQTDTYDICGKVVCEAESALVITEQMVEKVLDEFKGEIVQIVPPYSAIHICGERAYKLARQNFPFPQIKKKVTIKSIKLREFSYPYLTLEVCCSRGTYMRSLSHELGLKLGTGGVLSEVVRLSVGNFKISQAIELDKLSMYPPDKILTTIDSALSHLPAVKLPQQLATRFTHGNFVLYPLQAIGFLRIYDSWDRFLGIGTSQDKRTIKPVCTIV